MKQHEMKQHAWQERRVISAETGAFTPNNTLRPRGNDRLCPCAGVPHTAAEPPVSIFGTTDLAAPFMLQQPSTAATLTITQ